MTDTTTTQPENSDVTPPAKRQSLCWKYLSASVIFFLAIDCPICWLFRRADGDVAKDRSLKDKKLSLKGITNIIMSINILFPTKCIVMKIAIKIMVRS